MNIRISINITAENLAINTLLACSEETSRTRNLLLVLATEEQSMFTFIVKLNDILWIYFKGTLILNSYVTSIDFQECMLAGFLFHFFAKQLFWWDTNLDPRRSQPHPSLSSHVFLPFSISFSRFRSNPKWDGKRMGGWVEGGVTEYWSQWWST